MDAVVAAATAAMEDGKWKVGGKAKKDPSKTVSLFLAYYFSEHVTIKPLFDDIYMDTALSSLLLIVVVGARCKM